MANRGEAKTRFTSPGESKAQERKRAWQVIEEPGQLYVIFDDPELDVPPHQLNLSQWLPMGKLAPTFAKSFARCYLGSTRQTRFSEANNFRYGLVAYLVAIGLKLDEPSDAGPRLLFDFRNWIRTYPGVKSLKEGAVDDPPTKAAQDQANTQTQMNLWKPCKKIFQELIRQNPEGTWSIEIPKKPFAGEKFLPAPKKNIDLKEYIEFLTAAAQEASNTIDFIQPHLAPIARSIKQLQNGGKYNPGNIDHVVARVLIDYRGVIPERKYLLKSDPKLLREIELHGYTDVCRLAHPAFGDLIPFLYLVASYTGFNQQPLTHLELSQIHEPTILGVVRMTLSPPKFRAGTIVRRSFIVSDDKLAVTSIIHFIDAWTAQIRQAAPAFVRNDFWLFANKWKSGKGGNLPVRSLAAREKSNKSELSNHLLRYCKARGYKFTGMKEVRLSFSELFLRANPGDLEGLRVLLGQKSVATTANHYRTQQAVAEGEELLAGAMNMHQRWVGSDGKIDTRSSGDKRERTAATPGFNCADPYDSPIPGQQKGRMCQAFGLCPRCPLATTDSDLPYALARFHQLAEVFEHAKPRLGIEIWKRKYWESSNALSTQWIPSLTSAVIVDAARQLHLPRLPGLE